MHGASFEACGHFSVELPAAFGRGPAAVHSGDYCQAPGRSWGWSRLSRSCRRVRARVGPDPAQRFLLTQQHSGARLLKVPKNSGTSRAWQAPRVPPCAGEGQRSSYRNAVPPAAVCASARCSVGIRNRASECQLKKGLDGGAGVAAAVRLLSVCSGEDPAMALRDQ